VIRRDDHGIAVAELQTGAHGIGSDLPDEGLHNLGVELRRIRGHDEFCGIRGQHSFSVGTFRSQRVIDVRSGNDTPVP